MVNEPASFAALNHLLEISCHDSQYIILNTLPNQKR